MSFPMPRHALAAALAAAALGAAPAFADVVAPVSYEMPNGDGTAHGGSYNYWDATYDGNGALRTDGLSGSYLSGGLGALTDGVIATQPWYQVSNLHGTGQYVGWLDTDPSITFHFGTSVQLGEIRLFVDNSHVGGVTAPDWVSVNGVQVANPGWQSASGVQMIDLTGLHVTGDSVTIQLHDPGQWVFLSEAQFVTTAVPEPASGALLLAGLGIVATLARRRRA